ncbi:hypothetical protein A6F49_16530 [Enteractinococcus helveticum]|uniref:Uncharacterized protein n=1 Tax=Enteractinococcus helveticum TaxID=1837282 RepID=A0A1B7LWP5_9MICC|nr:hypothetical protein A6F49_16530 [Enteractinococcus helveticum]
MPAPEHAPNRSNHATTIGWSLAGILLGILTGAIGTVLHLNSYWTGSFGLPWGVVLALVIAWLAQWWIGLRSVSIVATGLTGIAQYVTLAAMVALNQGNHFSVPLNDQTWEFVPHLVIATLAWNIGIVAVTLLSLIQLARTMRRTKAELAANQSYLTPAVGPWDKQ